MRISLKARVDYEVDRLGVEAQQRVELTSTNRPFGLTLGTVHVWRVRSPRFRATHARGQNGPLRLEPCTQRTQSLPTRHGGSAIGPSAARRQFLLVAIAEGPHPIPSRTRSLSLPAPMVLQGRPCGRVGRRQRYAPFARRGLFIWVCSRSSGENLPLGLRVGYAPPHARIVQETGSWHSVLWPATVCLAAANPPSAGSETVAGASGLAADRRAGAELGGGAGGCGGDDEGSAPDSPG